ncbi:MAG TPA: hypothetical protein VL588_11970, partial [Bdellovibrionota bacterium]|nr:hypothetical protein [Bdellovibrionota bacterium]
MLWALIFFWILPARGESCPTTLPAWERWRAEVLSDLKTPADLGDGRADLIEACAAEPTLTRLYGSPEFHRAMGPLRQAIQASASLQPKAPNSPVLLDPDTYYAAAGKLADLTALPAPFVDRRFLRALSGGAIAEIQRRWGRAPLVRYQPLFFETDVYVALMRSPLFDRWVHVFAGRMHGISDAILLSIQHRDADGRPLERPLARFAEYTLNPSAGRPLGGRRPATSLNCFQCHRAGAMPLIPTEGSHPISLTRGREVGDLLSDMNAVVEESARALPVGFTLAGLGPPMGPVSAPGRTDAFLDSCARPVTLDGPTRRSLRQAMACTTCHDGSTLGVLNAPLGPHDFPHATRYGIVEGFVRSGAMPPDNDLSPEARGALYRCLMAEYYGGMAGLP